MTIQVARGMRDDAGVKKLKQQTIKEEER